MKYALTLTVALAAAGCKKTGHDDMYVPYQLKGLEVVFCDEDEQCDTVGSVSGSYEQRDSLKAQCRDLAFREASKRGVEDTRWSYVCCTVTPTSSCATEVR